MSNKTPNKGVPGVPLAALDAITDENTRLVLRSIVDGWHVRNGASGDGTNAFITKAEMGQFQQNLTFMGSGMGSARAQRQTDPNVLTAGEISRIINDLQAQVMESVLFKELGERIALIDTTGLANGNTIRQEIIDRSNADNAIYTATNSQFSALNGNVGAIQAAQTTMANNVAALATQTNTLQASVGQNTIALQQESTTRINADNDIYAKYSVKIDNNGYVSGFGLISTANNSTPYSDFMVRADRFAIASPSGPGITPQVPFIVLTTPDSKGNLPGVYIDNVMIKNAAIGTAQIDDLSVNTLKIAGNAVTIPIGVFAAANSVSAVLTLDGNYPVFVLGSLTQSYFSDITLYRNGLSLWREIPIGGTLATRGIVDYPGPGTHTYQLVSSDGRNTNATSLFLLAVKR